MYNTGISVVDFRPDGSLGLRYTTALTTCAELILNELEAMPFPETMWAVSPYWKALTSPAS